MANKSSCSENGKCGADLRAVSTGEKAMTDPLREQAQVGCPTCSGSGRRTYVNPSALNGFTETDCPECLRVEAALRDVQRETITNEELNPWKAVLVDAAVVNWVLSAKNKDDPRKMLTDLLEQEMSEILDPHISEGAAKLVLETRAAVEAEIAADPDRCVGLKKRLLAQVRESVQRETIRQDAAWIQKAVETLDDVLSGEMGPNVSKKALTQLRDSLTCGLADRLKEIEK